MDEGLQRQREREKRALRIERLLLAMALALGPAALMAMPIETGNADLRINWDTTVKYSAGFRVEGRSATLTGDPTQDDGDRNFGRGLISNRLDLLSEVDLRYKRTGFRLSGAAWYDTVYNRRNDNDSAGLFGPGSNSVNHSPATAAYDEFTPDTRSLHGRKAELLDGFVFANFDVGDRPASLRLGQHTVLYGESLFLGANGIAAAQAPIDVVKALSVPGTQFKELMRPVPQVSGTLQLSDDVSLGAYYQFRWEGNRIPGVGSYFSIADNVGAGAERLLPLSLPGGLPGGVARQGDLEPRNSGQGGVQLRFRVGESDYGVYAARFHSKDFDQVTKLGILSPPGVVPPTIAPAAYQLQYAEGIQVYGASWSRSFGEANVAGEVSYRRNMPFLSQAVAGPGQPSDNDDHPVYAVGNSLHAQVSTLWQLPRTAVFTEGTLAAELAWHRALGITRNAAAVDPHTTRDAWALRLVLAPVYRQALPGLDVELPIGLGWNPAGRSRVIPQFNNGAATHGGDLSLGVNGIYLDSWRFGLNWTHYFGPAGTFIEPVPGAPAGAVQRSNACSYCDRDFVSFTARRTF